MTTATEGSFIKRNAVNLTYLVALIFSGLGLTATAMTSPDMASVAGLASLVCIVGALLEILSNTDRDERPTTESAALWLLNVSLVAAIIFWCLYHASRLF